MPNQDLLNRLDSYSETLETTPASSQLLEHLHSWPAFAVAGGASLAMVASAGAAIIYSGPQNVVANNTNGPQTIAIGTGSGVKISAFTNTLFSTGAAQLNGQGNGVLRNASSQAKRLLSGSVISNGGSFGTGPKFLLYQTSSGSFDQGTWSVSDVAFAGVKLNDPLGTHYGWIRLHITDTNGAGFPAEVTAIDWAYNDVNGASIKAGDTGVVSVPEPATMAMTLFAAGAAGVLAWRRRKAQAEAAAV
ncbi:MAG: PEP-CTERM sorting domain-containing protein [Planctomycetales bacterium]